MTPELPGSFAPPTKTVVERLRYWAEHKGGARAFTYLVDGETEEINLTYGELDRKARAIAARLEAENLQGERALLLYPPGLEFITAFFGCLYAGVIAVPAYPPRRNRNMGRIQAIAADADARIAMTEVHVMERVKGMLHEAPRLQEMKWLSTDNITEVIADQWVAPRIDGDTLAFLQYTSGSTGTPKGVTLTHANLMHNSALISYSFEITRSGSGVFWLPIYHDMGLIGGILQPMYVGEPNILMSPMAFLQKPVRWLQAVTRYGAVISGGPNFAYDICVEKIKPAEMEKLDLSTWELAFNGAEQVRASTLERFAEKFAPCGFDRKAFYPCYGMAEATLLISGGLKRKVPVTRTIDGESLVNSRIVDAYPDESGSRTLVSCGSVMPDQEIIIVDPETRQRQPDDHVGEIWVAGPSISQGYWKKPEVNEEIFNAHTSDSNLGPFLRTGDMGFLQDGEVYVTGRLKDMIIIRGVNRYPQDIETSTAAAHDQIRPLGLAAFAFEADGQERLGVVAEVIRTAKSDWDAVIETIRREVAAEHEVPLDAICLIRGGTIPKTSSGKIQRFACREKFLDGTLSLVAQWCSWDKSEEDSATDKTATPIAVPSETLPEEINPETAQTVLEHVQAVGKERAKNLTLDTNIIELGLDSLERMEIVAALEETFSGRFPEHVILEMETCREVILAVQKYLGENAHKKEKIKIEPSFYEFDKFPEIERLSKARELYDRYGIKNPFFTVHEGITSDTTTIGEKEYINYSSFNYVGMAGDPAVIRAAKGALDQYGASVSASRLVSGEKPVHGEMERAIADFIGTEASLIFSSGHGTNESTIGHLFGPGDLILHDGLAHNSIVQGSILSGARRRAFPHNDWDALDKILTEMRPHYRKVLVAIEGVYSMDGDFANLPRFIEVKKRHKCLLLIDEAHSLGTMGAHGRGMSEYYDIHPRDVDIWMGTLSKGLGSVGGYISGCKELVEYLKYTAPGFVFATGIPAHNVAAALAALRLLEEEPERVARCQDRARLFIQLCKERGIDTGLSGGTPIVPIIIGNSAHAMLAAHTMFDQGINVQPILHPAVEESAARLRFFINSEHTEEHIRHTVDVLTESLLAVDPKYVPNPPGQEKPAGFPVTKKSEESPSTRPR